MLFEEWSGWTYIDMDVPNAKGVKAKKAACVQIRSALGETVLRILSTF